MGDIYRQSYLTIFAAAGENPSSGLGRKRDPVIAQDVSVGVELQDGDQLAKFQLVLSPPRVHRSVESVDCPLYRRAWVLQEQVLSVRAMIFDVDELRWRCLCGEASERSPAWYHADQREKMLNSDPFMGLRSCLFLKSQPKDILNTYGFTLTRIWYLLVRNYSARQLTVMSDVLPALSGISSLFSRMHGYTFLAGLLEEDIHRGLTWTFAESHLSRRINASQCKLSTVYGHF